MEAKIIEYITNLLDLYGWYFLAIVGATVLVMIPVNLIIKKIFAKATSDSVVRIRKTLSSVLVYGVACGAIAVANLITHTPIELEYIAINCVPVGALAMVAWAVIKLIRDLGVKQLFTLIAKSKTIKSILKGLPVDTDIALAIYDKLAKAVEESTGDNLEIVEQKNKLLNEMATSMLEGFVSLDEISGTAQAIVETLKLKFTK